MSDPPVLPSLTPAEADELRRLVWTLRADSSDAAQIARIEELTCQRDGGAEQYILAADLVANLFWCFRNVESQSSGRTSGNLEPSLTGQAVEQSGTRAASVTSVPAPTPVPAPNTATAGIPIATVARRSPRFWSMSVRARLAATLLVGLAFYGTFTAISWNIRAKRERAPRPVAIGETPAASDESANPANQVAQITASEDAKWQTGTPEDPNAPVQHSAFSIQHSQIPRSAPLNLASGTVALQLNKGVKLLVEGPAQWTIDGDNRATLTRGKLIATVPQQAIGFTVKTPTSEIVDLGTEFGVEVDERGQTQTNVFRGEIRVEQPAVAAAPAKKSITLTAGQAVSIDRSGHATFIQPLASTPAQFIRPPASTAEDNFNPEALSPYARYVIEQTKPVAYWDFSWYRDSMKIVNDRIAARPFEQFSPRHVGMLGPSANLGLAGFGGTNPALEFDHRFASECLALPVQARGEKVPAKHFSLPLSPQAYSLQVWIQSSIDFNRQILHYVWALGMPGFLDDALMVSGTHFTSASLPRNSKSKESAIGRLVYLGCNDDGELRFGPTVLEAHRWYCLTLVRDGRQVAIYLNGKLEIESSLAWANRANNRLTFGQRANPLANAGWRGLIDEIAVWDRPLSAQDVSALYEQAIEKAVPHPSREKEP